MALRHTIKITVTPTAKTVIEKFSEKNGMAEIQVASRAYEWFSRQSDVVKKGICGLLPEGFEVDIAKLALERMAKKR